MAVLVLVSVTWLPTFQKSLEFSGAKQHFAANLTFIYLLIHVFSQSPCFWAQGYKGQQESMPVVIWQKQGDTLDKSRVHHKTSYKTVEQK